MVGGRPNERSVRARFEGSILESRGRDPVATQPAGGWLRPLVFFRAAVAVVTLIACSAAWGHDKVDLRVRRDVYARRSIVARDIVVGGVAGAIVSGGVLAYASSAGYGAQDWKPVLATGVGAGLVIGLAVGMIEANRYGQDQPARPTSDGLSFQEQHTHDKSGVFVAELPPVRF
jgi:hypothetical protein